MKKIFIKTFSSIIYPFLQEIYKDFSRISLKKFLSHSLSKFFLEEKTNNEILIVGSGGELEKIIRMNKNLNVISIDIDPLRKPDFVCDISETYFEEARFDMVIALEVFEHIKYPNKAVNEIYRLLKPKGCFLMSVPFMFPIHDEPYDFQRWTLQGIRFLTKQFRNVQISNKHNEVISVLVIISRLFFSSRNLWLRISGAFFILLGAILPNRFFLHSKKYSNISTGYLINANK